MKRLRLTFAIGILIISSTAVHAQMSPDLIMETYNSNIQVITSGIINKSMLDKAVARNNAKGGRSRSASAKASVRSNSFAYVPTAALKKQAVDAYVAQVKVTNPALATTLAANLAPGKTDYSALYHEINQGSGLVENNAADVFAAYLILNWMVINNIQDGKAITVHMARGVRTQTANVLAQNPKLSAPGTVAQMGEQFKLNAALLQVGWLRSIQDKTDGDYRQKIAAKFQNQYHMDMSKMQLTAQGLTKK